MSESPQRTPGSAPPKDRQTLIEATDLHVTYTISEDVHRPTVQRLLTRRFRRRPTRAVEAVRGVTLSAAEGECIGIIGRNGSGKSTLLRVFGGLLPATRGEVMATSTPVLLGVSAAMNPELSGRRNIYLGGTALGMRRSEVAERLPGIVEFAGLGDFIDMPIRAYSSGMQARLQFAIASSVSPEILLVDEALSVGDESFQRRCRERIAELAAAAGTVFVVSHSAATIKEMCGRAVWLHNGSIVADGPSEDVVDEYQRAMREQ